MGLSWLIRQARGDKLTSRKHRKQTHKQTQVTLRIARLDILLAGNPAHLSRPLLTCKGHARPGTSQLAGHWPVKMAAGLAGLLKADQVSLDS
jgi:hypothetical protein